MFAGLLVYCLLAVCTYKIQFCSSYSKTWGGGVPFPDCKRNFLFAQDNMDISPILSYIQAVDIGRAGRGNAVFFVWKRHKGRR